MMNHLRLLCSITFLAIGITAQAQIYNFPTLYSPASCAYTYQIATTIHLDSVRVTNVYYDDGTTGSFAFEAYVTYNNVFANSTLPTGNYYTYSISLYSDNPNLTSNFLTNNIGTVPLQTHTAGGLASQNNPTYNGSASALGLAQGQYYSSPAILSQLGFDSASLLIGLPCMDTTVQSDSTFPLSMLWSPLSGQCIDNDVVLNWQTFSEQNNVGFNVERSIDATHWSTIGRVQSLSKDGNNQETLSYQFKWHEAMQGTYYYRVVQRNADGTSSISNIVMLAASKSQQGLDIYPNPANVFLYLNNVPEFSAFTINDLTGKIMLKGRYSNGINVSGLKKGLYLLQCNGQHSKLIIGF